MLGTAPHHAVFFVWLIVDQPIFLIIFACSLHPSHQLEQAHQGDCSKKTPSLAHVPELGDPVPSESAFSTGSPIDGGAPPSPPFYLPIRRGDSSSPI